MSRDGPSVALVDGRTGITVHVLQDGEDWEWHPGGGVIITHPERPSIWVRVVDGLVVTREEWPA